jgi:hypothetical protein
MKRPNTKFLFVCWMLIILTAWPVGATPMLYDYFLDQPLPYRYPGELDEILWVTSGLFSPFFSLATGIFAMTWETGWWEQGGLASSPFHELTWP